MGKTSQIRWLSPSVFFHRSFMSAMILGRLLHDFTPVSQWRAPQCMTVHNVYMWSLCFRSPWHPVSHTGVRLRPSTLFCYILTMFCHYYLCWLGFPKFDSKEPSLPALLPLRSYFYNSHIISWYNTGCICDFRYFRMTPFTGRFLQNRNRDIRNIRKCNQ